MQAGTQGRSSRALQQAFEFIRSGQIGPVLYAHAVNYKRRPSIGKVDGPQPVPSTVDYNLWRGPAPMEPLMRENLHYDWHWVWSTGNGEMGKNGGRIKEFRGVEEFAELAVRHLTNFAEAVRNRNPETLSADIREGHVSAAGCHMANVSHLLGAQATPQRIMKETKANSQLSDAFERCRDHLRSNGVDIGKTPAVLGPWVTMDPDQQTFVGEFAHRANELSKRVYRKPFVVPNVT